QVIGRIAAIRNNNHNALHQRLDGFFGFFECINDQAAADQLLGEAEKWLKEQGLQSMIGPVNFSTNETCGLLIEGFNGSPMVMMPYTPPYYRTALENRGCRQQVPLRAYSCHYTRYGARSVRLLGSLQERLRPNSIVV